MPEDSDPAFRRVSFTDTWKTNVHWMKMVDLDQVHLHIVHGIPLNEENPSRPSEHSVEWLENGFRTHLVSRPPPPAAATAGTWAAACRPGGRATQGAGGFAACTGRCRALG